MQKFWNLVLPEEAEKPAELYLEGEIAAESWYGDEVTPKQFREELASVSGRDVTVWINSPGGDVFAASIIYTALMEHKGAVTVKIEGLAASAASVIAMAGDKVLMAPTAFLMIHNPWSMGCGDAEELRHTAAVLDEIADGLVLAYEIKTGLPRDTIRQMMADETWMSAQAAIDNGFADGMLLRGSETDAQNVLRNCKFGSIAACARTLKRISAKMPEPPKPANQEARDMLIKKMQTAKAALNDYPTIK